MKKVAVLGGGGLMGHGMVLACLRNADTEVWMVSRRQESLDLGLSLVHTGPFGIQKGMARGKITPEEAEGMLARLHGTVDYEEGLFEVDLVFETVPESLEVKKAALLQAERLAPVTALFASGTSSIMIAELAGALEDPGRLVGTHWFYPANVMPLVEVVRSELSRADTLEAVLDFLRESDKQPVLVNDGPGFFMTRFINLYVAEAIHLVELGLTTPAAIDEMVKTGLGWPLGVFELLDDTAGFDSWYHAQEYLFATCGERYAIPVLARKVFRSGFRGNPVLKPGSRGGWYDYLGISRVQKKE